MQFTASPYGFRAKAILCASLVFVQPLFTGCQSTPKTSLTGIPAAARYHVELTAAHEMTGALNDSSFEGAKAIDIYPAAQRFEVLFPDANRHITGNYAFVDGEFTIVDFRYESAGGVAQFTFSEAKQITAISTSRGDWKRPPESKIPRSPSLRGPEAYAAANADILEVARQLDEQGAKSDGGGLLMGLTVLLLYTAWLWAPVAATMQAVLTIFIVSTILQTVTGSRFDGIWNASNASSSLELTIADGRIIRMVDVSGQQQLSIVDSDLQQVEGTDVSWKVLARLLGRPDDVEFDFDVQELANGALSGTLTTTNGGSATVPIIMSRA